MYPAQDLRRLAARKAALRRNIALHRAQCEGSAARLAKPVEWLDRMVASWRRLAPIAKFAAVPVAFLATRRVFSGLKFVTPLLRWAPLAFGAARGIGAALSARSRSASR